MNIRSSNLELYSRNNVPLSLPSTIIISYNHRYQISSRKLNFKTSLAILCGYGTNTHFVTTDLCRCSVLQKKKGIPFSMQLKSFATGFTLYFHFQNNWMTMNNHVYCIKFEQHGFGDMVPIIINIFWILFVFLFLNNFGTSISQFLAQRRCVLCFRNLVYVTENPSFFKTLRLSNFQYLCLC